MIERKFAMEHLPDDPLFKLAYVCYEAIPPVLRKDLSFRCAGFRVHHDRRVHQQRAY